jgi:hypothetical protein
MGAARFREQAARMDALLVDRLGDRALTADGTEVAGAFFSPYFGQEVKGGTHKIGVVANADEVTQPTFTLRAVDAAAFKKGSLLTVDLPDEEGGGVYVVVRLTPDGCGMVGLELRFERERAGSVTPSDDPDHQGGLA